MPIKCFLVSQSILTFNLDFLTYIKVTL